MILWNTLPQLNEKQIKLYNSKFKARKSKIEDLRVVYEDTYKLQLLNRRGYRYTIVKRNKNKIV